VLGSNLSTSALNMSIESTAQKYRWQQALDLFETARSLRKMDIVTLNICLTAAVRAERWQQALALLAEAPRWGLQLTSASLGAGLDAAQRGSAWQLALWLRAQNLGGAANAVAVNAAVGAAAGASRWEIALELLQDHHLLNA
ncbi:unnamed protein product, partial [Symbiodinium pilosum]